MKSRFRLILSLVLVMAMTAGMSISVHAANGTMADPWTVIPSSGVLTPDAATVALAKVQGTRASLDIAPALEADPTVALLADEIRITPSEVLQVYNTSTKKQEWTVVNSLGIPTKNNILMDIAKGVDITKITINNVDVTPGPYTFKSGTEYDIVVTSSNSAKSFRWIFTVPVSEKDAPVLTVSGPGVKSGDTAGVIISEVGNSLLRDLVFTFTDNTGVETLKIFEYSDSTFSTLKPSGLQNYLAMEPSLAPDIKIGSMEFSASNLLTGKSNAVYEQDQNTMRVKNFAFTQGFSSSNSYIAIEAVDSFGNQSNFQVHVIGMTGTVDTTPPLVVVNNITATKDAEGAVQSITADLVASSAQGIALLKATVDDTLVVDVNGLTNQKTVTRSFEMRKTAASKVISGVAETETGNKNEFNIDLATHFNGGGGGGDDYTITYNVNGGGGGIVTDNNTYKSGATATIKSGSVLAHASKGVFSHWNTKADDTGTKYNAGNEITVTSNVTLYAQYGSGGGGDGDKFKVTYKANGGTGSDSVFSDIPANDMHVVQYNQGIVPSGPQFVGPSGRAWQSWNTRSDGSGTKYMPFDEIRITGNVTLYAIWAGSNSKGKDGTYDDGGPNSFLENNDIKDALTGPHFSYEEDTTTVTYFLDGKKGDAKLTATVNQLSNAFGETFEDTEEGDSATTRIYWTGSGYRIEASFDKDSNPVGNYSLKLKVDKKSYTPKSFFIDYRDETVAAAGFIVDYDTSKQGQVTVTLTMKANRVKEYLGYDDDTPLEDDEKLNRTKWSTPDGNSTGSSASFTVTEAGTYKVKVTYLDDTYTHNIVIPANLGLKDPGNSNNNNNNNNNDNNNNSSSSSNGTSNTRYQGTDAPVAGSGLVENVTSSEIRVKIPFTNYNTNEWKLETSSLPANVNHENVSGGLVFVLPNEEFRMTFRLVNSKNEYVEYTFPVSKLNSDGTKANNSQTGGAGAATGAGPVDIYNDDRELRRRRAILDDSEPE